VLAMKYAVREEPRRAEEFLDILDPLAADGDEYVRKNLGPFAVGDAFLRVAPDPTMKRLERWARSKDEWTRWNAVSAFTAAGARRHAAEALPLLRIAAGDRRPMVSRAVVRALLNLAQAERTAVVKAVATWGEDEARRTTASAFSSRLMGRSM
jgi:HEAT repeat protein